MLFNWETGVLQNIRITFMNELDSRSWPTTFQNIFEINIVTSSLDDSFKNDKNVILKVDI